MFTLTLEQCHRDTQFQIRRFAARLKADPKDVFDKWLHYKAQCEAVDQPPKFKEFEAAYVNGWGA